MLLGVLGITVIGSFTQNATRALFLLPGQQPVAFAAVVQPTGDGIGIGDLGRGARRLIPGRRGGTGGPVGGTPPPAAAGGNGVPVDQFRPEGSPGTLENATDPGGGGGGQQRTNGFQPGTSPLVGGGASPLLASAPVEITPAVPEPPAWILGLGGLALLGTLRQLRGHLLRRRGMPAANS